MPNNKKAIDAASIPMLEKRRIEAAIIKNIYDVLVERHGQSEAEAIVSEAVIQSAIDQGKYFRDQHGKDPDLLDYSKLMELWEMDGALEKRYLHKSPERLEYDMTYCAYAEMYKEMGLADIGHLLSCNRDGSFCIGYNPKMKMNRTQTIMQGADYCDFRYKMEDDE